MCVDWKAKALFVDFCCTYFREKNIMNLKWICCLKLEHQGGEKKSRLIFHTQTVQSGRASLTHTRSGGGGDFKFLGSHAWKAEVPLPPHLEVVVRHSCLKSWSPSFFKHKSGGFKLVRPSCCQLSVSKVDSRYVWRKLLSEVAGKVLKGDE